MAASLASVRIVCDRRLSKVFTTNRTDHRNLIQYRLCVTPCGTVLFHHLLFYRRLFHYPQYNQEIEISRKFIERLRNRLGRLPACFFIPLLKLDKILFYRRLFHYPQYNQEIEISRKFIERLRNRLGRLPACFFIPLLKLDKRIVLSMKRVHLMILQVVAQLL